MDALCCKMILLCRILFFFSRNRSYAMAIAPRQPLPEIQCDDEFDDAIWNITIVFFGFHMKIWICCALA